MRKTIKSISLILALLMLAVILPGCSSKSDSDYKYIKDKGTLVIGITQYPPMNFYDENGKLIGFDTELAEVVCEARIES